MAWKFSGDRPVYLQVCEQFEAFILSGEIQPGQRLLGVRDLATVVGVNAGTMQKALSELERHGVVRTHGTLGRTVTDDEAVLNNLRQQRAAIAAEVCAQAFLDLGLDQATYDRELKEAWFRLNGSKNEKDSVTTTTVKEETFYDAK